MRFFKLFILVLVLGISPFANAQLIARFTADTTQGCTPVTIRFKDQSTGSNLRYLWTLGNGNVSTLQNPEAIYYLPGKYTVSLTITDSTGKKATETKNQYLTVFKNPTANFSANNVSGCVPLHVVLKDETTLGDASIQQYLWDFGDGNTSSSVNPSHNYSIDGKFNLSLLVTDKNQCQSKLIKSNYITLKRTPIIDIDADKKFSCTAPLSVSFYDKSSKTSSSDTYLWDFGDGNTSSLKNPSHTYTKIDKYTISLTIKTSEGCETVGVFPDYINIGGLYVDFDANIKNACAPVEITFTNKTIPNKLKSTWYFSDGTKETGYNVTHTFTTKGSYDVRLEVEENATCKDSKTKTGFISIIDPPKADFTLNDSITCKKPFTAISTNTSKNTTNIDWLVDETSIGQQNIMAHTFANYGTYKYTLVAKNEYNCEDKKKIEIKINPPEVILEADKYEGCKPLTVTFFDRSNLTDVASKTWNFGDGSSPSSSLASSIQHTFNDTGTFKVSLVVKTKNGCEGYAEIEIKVGMKTNPSFIFTKDSICNGTTFFAENTTDLDKPNLKSIKWHIYTDDQPFKQDSTYEEEDFYLKIPPYTRTADNLNLPLDHDSGWYNVALITQHNGCFDTTIADSAFYVKNPKTIIEELPFDPCHYSQITLINKSKGADSIVWQVTSTKHPPYKSSHDTIVIKKSVHGNTAVVLSSYNKESKCWHTKGKQIEFIEAFDADFEFAGDACSPANLNFNVIKTDSMLSLYTYEWKVENQSFVGDSPRFFYRFDNPGAYTVRLKVVQVQTNCWDTISKSVSITGPQIEGELSYSGSCAPLPLVLKLKSNLANFDSVYWSIDGRTVPITSSATLYDTLFKPGPDSAGIHTIKLVGIDTNGCVGYQDFEVPVEGPTTPFIKIRRFAGCEGNRFIFNAEVPGYDPSDFAYRWDLGNGDTSNLNVVNAYYPANNIYTIKLKLIEKNGCTSTLTETIDIEKERLYAHFEADGLETNCPPLFVEFKNKSEAKGRKITSYYWEFGDGSISREANPSKLYLTAGKFTVKLFITDEWGCADSVIFPDFVLVEGPEGSYTFDKDRGCVPLEVNFESSTTGTNFYEWDLGDGKVVQNKTAVNHTFTQPGMYIPLLILTDTFGCSYTLPPIDTIYVNPYPEPDFIYEGTCINYPIAFEGFNGATDSTEDFYLWEMIGENKVDTLFGAKVNYTFYNKINPSVRLNITTKNGCATSVEKEIKLKKLALDFASERPSNCVGSEIQLKNLTQSDTTIIFTQWIIEGDTSFEESPRFVAKKIGPLNIRLVQHNSIGCKDTLHQQTVIIGDTIPPKDLDMLRVTVNDNETVQLDYMQANFSDFASYLIYKDNASSFLLIDEIEDRQSTTYINNQNNTLVQSYCFKIEVKNACGLVSDTLTANAHCTINVEAEGGRNRNDVQWNHYTGWDSVSSYTILRQEVGIPSNWRKLAEVSGGTTNYIDSLVYCNTTYAYRIQATEFGGNSQISMSDTAHATPIWDYTPPPNQLIRATVEDDKEVLIEWSKIVNSQIPITHYVLEKSRNGEDYSAILSANASTFSFVDKQVAVDDYSYFYRTYAIDECLDTSIFLNFGKTILLKADTGAEQRPSLNWSTYQGWTEPVTHYIIEIRNPDNTFTQIGTTDAIDSSLIDIWTNLNQRPEYCYRVIGYKELVNGEKQIVSVSNEDCSPVRSTIFYPNAFTPTRDNLNDRYVTPGMYIKEYHITIFNRWGEKVFESFSMEDNWDGTYKGKPAQQDAYAVIVETIGVDLVKRVHFGTITLLR